MQNVTTCGPQFECVRVIDGQGSVHSSSIRDLINKELKREELLQEINVMRSCILLRDERIIRKEKAV